MREDEVREGEHWEPLAPGCRVLISRAHRFTTDTILLAHFAAPKKWERCADLGTGCGTIPLLWHARYAPRAITGVELDADALRQARISVRENGLKEEIAIQGGDIRAIRAVFPEPALDLVACNPPYKAVGAGLRNADARMENARHECTCTLDDVAQAAKAILRFGGRLCICQRPERLTDAMAAFRANGVEPKRLRLVQQRWQSAPMLFLLEGRRGGRPGLEILPTLFVEAADGGFSAEMLEIYGDYKTGHTDTENRTPQAPGAERSASQNQSGR